MPILEEQVTVSGGELLSGAKACRPSGASVIGLRLSGQQSGRGCVIGLAHGGESPLHNTPM